jgi:hypothetical protein
MRTNPRVATRQVAEMHLNERLEKSREALGQQLAVGQQKVSSAYNRLWAEMEAMREAQKKRAEEQRALAEKEGRVVDGKCKFTSLPSILDMLLIGGCLLIMKLGKPQPPDLSHAQANIQAAKQSAGAYFSSWGTWASEKRKGWGNKTPSSSPGPLSPDMKRAEEFKRDKEATIGVEGGDGGKDVKRNSLFFDADADLEKDVEKEKGGVEVVKEGRS